MVRERTGIYPGTFDPIHNGHVDIIRRATVLVDRLVVAVAINAGKEPLFALEERAAMVEAEVAAILGAKGSNGTRIEVQAFKTLLMHFAAENRAEVVVRGLRAVSDFEFEFQIANMNRHLLPDLETVFVMTGEDYFFVSARIVREVATFGGDVSAFVPPNVLESLRKKLAGRPVK
jgi:pantetheine-phosphate adenylyltransferase